MIILKDMTPPNQGRTTRSPRVETRIGRDPSADVHYDKEAAPTVSRDHARIRFDGRWYRIDDQDSRHGTWVNNQRLGGLTYLKHGDVIQLGGGGGPKLRVVFEYDRAVVKKRREEAESSGGIPWVWVGIFGGMGLLFAIFAVAMYFVMFGGGQG